MVLLWDIRTMVFTYSFLIVDFFFLFFLIIRGLIYMKKEKTIALQWKDWSPQFSYKQLYQPKPKALQFSSVQMFSHVRLFRTPWIAARQASLTITNSRSLSKPTSIELVMPSNHLILCHPLLLPSIFPSIRVFSNESGLHIRWPKYWSFSFSISPSSDNWYFSLSKII